MLRYLSLSTLLLAMLAFQGCTRDPSYFDTIQVDEGDARWEVTLHGVEFRHPHMIVELEYGNMRGASYTLHPRHVIVFDDQGNRIPSSGGNAILPLVRPGESYRIKVAFATVPLSGHAFYLHPFHGLAKDDPRFLLKKAGGIPLPGEHMAADWDIPR